MDLVNSDCILIMGSNMAENHPVGFRFVVEARERGAQVIHVDPRFTRTSASATRHVAIRSGSDIVFLGALINHVLTGGHLFREYVRDFTNGPAILPEEYVDAEDNDGLFSGFVASPDGGGYDLAQAHWSYGERAAPGPEHVIERDPAMEHPRCVLQVLRRHFARYTPEMVERVCGTPREEFEAVARALVENSGPERTSAICYAVGWTQQSIGPQIIRAAAILQLLLGQHGPSRRRDHRAPRSREHPGVDRHPHPLRPPPRLPPPAARRRRPRRPRRLLRGGAAAARGVVEHAELHRQPAHRLVRGRRRRGPRLPLARPAHRRPQRAGGVRRHARRQDAGLPPRSARTPPPGTPTRRWCARR